MPIADERSRVKRVEAPHAPRPLRLFAPREVLGVSHCAICGESSVELVLEAHTDHIPRVYRITEEDHPNCWDLWRCRQCGLIFSDWHLTPDELHGLYRRMHDELYDAEDACRRLTFRRGLGLIAENVARADAAPPGRLLDVGCATGSFLEEARDLGWQVEGVDLSRWAIDRARARGIEPVHEGTVYTLPGPAERFDVVTMLDYIEHDDAPDRLIEQVRSLLKRGGCLYITSPDIGGLTARMLGARWWGINPLHLYYFSHDCLGRLLRRHGFEVVVSRSYTRVFTLGYWASRLEHFHPVPARVATTVFRALGVANLRIPLNLGDMMEVVARKQ
jgi:SAM-dependent methyltransferase